MNSSVDTPSPWHRGEKQLQERAGVADRMEQFGRKVIRDYMPEQHRDFYRQLPFLLLGAVDDAGHPWASILEGNPGFAHSPDPRTLHIGAALSPLDPLASALSEGSAVGLLGIELHSRRRNRLNGQVTRQESGGFDITVEHAFGNCPQYIQCREYVVLSLVDHGPDGLPQKDSVAATDTAERFNALDEAARHFIQASDTFFVASYINHSDGRRSVDVSHRGGKPGFVRVQGNRLSIPDFAGNLHFNTLGNLLVNPRAGLLFLDFDSGDILQLTGRAELTLEGDEIHAFQGAERLWHVDVESCVRRKAALKLRWQLRDFSPNCLMTGSWEEAQSRLEARALRNQWRPLKVVRVETESSNIRSFYLEPADGAGWPTFSAGQHLPVRLHIPGHSQPVIRTYSLSSAPSDNFLRISVKWVGVASRFLHEAIGVGSVIEAKAAQGGFTLDPEARRPVVLLGAGVGVSPMMGMLREALYQNRRLRRNRGIWWVQSARQGNELAFADELQDLQRTAKVNVTRILSQPEPLSREGIDYDRKGRIDMALLQSLLPLDDYDFYLCGPGPFMQDMYDGLRALNIDDSRIHAESFGPSSLRRKPDASRTAEPLLPVASSPVPVLFQRSAKEARWHPGQGSLLELAESRGLQPEFSCRNGACGTCLTRVISGSVTYSSATVMTPEEGMALLCCAQPAERDSQSTPVILDL